MGILDSAILSTDSTTLAAALLLLLTADNNFLQRKSSTVAQRTPTQVAADLAPVFANDAISGNAITGGTISNFASTGIHDLGAASVLFITSANTVNVGAANTGGKLSAQDDGVATRVFCTYTTAGVFEVYVPSGLTMAAGENAANAPLKARRDSTTSRSFNAAGTVNASGADYADYYFKADGCGAIAKGQGVGFDTDGLITDKWANAVTFGVKSTAPSYVGGDLWGSAASLGLDEPEKPVAPIAPADDGRISYDDLQAQIAAYPGMVSAYNAALVQFQTDKTVFDAALETQRQKVDRIAVAGKVPAIVSGTVVDGGWIVPAQNGTGIDLICIADADLTFAQYKGRLGRVLVANPDESQLRRLVPAKIENPGWTAIVDVVRGS